ncbi:MAG: hypothetical protein IT457_13225 [Planctomycetes bacterium]|nr:hypothetical protein [Planctomycetota bacterium]
MSIANRVVAVLAALSLAVTPIAAQKGGIGAPSAVALEAGGKVFMLRRASGGDAVAEVIVQPTGPQAVAKKRVGAVRFEPLVVTGDFEDFLPWIRDALAGKPPRLDVSIAQLDLNQKVAHRLVAQRAQLVKIEFPALDASSKDLLDVTLSFQPERVTSGTAGDSIAGSVARQKRAGVANFRVTIPGVDCTRVARVAPITVAFEGVASGVGTGRGKVSEQITMRVGDLALGVGEAGAAGFVDWAKATLLEGKTEGLATTATVEVLTQDLKSTVLRLDAAGVGLYALRRVQASGDRMTSYDVSCFVEQWAVGK